MNKRIHFIAIGGSAMHNLALALHDKGYNITGSDDEINEPSRSRLAAKNLLPAEDGWFPGKLDAGIEAVILGMHARADNPELLRAQELGLKIYSYPEYLYEQGKDKLRVVIGGSHGKTTITSMIMHVMKECGREFDYMVGAKVEGFDTMVRLSKSAPVIILEGDEYLSSPIDRRPKFHLYHADIGLISGIAWDHINVFPTFENYVSQFQKFADDLPSSGVLVYCETDVKVKRVAEKTTSRCRKVPYGIPDHRVEDGITILADGTALKVFGDHNLANMEGARKVCAELGIDDTRFNLAMSSFTGAARRLELLSKGQAVSVYKDFAHSPSKLKATTEAVRKQFPRKKLVACMELHTFSSLNESFLAEYNKSMSGADVPIVYYNPHTIEHKRLKPITTEQVKNAFGDDRIRVYTDSGKLKNDLLREPYDDAVLLLMSSGTFDGLQLEQLAKEITNS